MGLASLGWMRGGDDTLVRAYVSETRIWCRRLSLYSTGRPVGLELRSVLPLGAQRRVREGVSWFLSFHFVSCAVEPLRSLCSLICLGLLLLLLGKGYGPHFERDRRPILLSLFTYLFWMASAVGRYHSSVAIYVRRYAFKINFCLSVCLLCLGLCSFDFIGYVGCVGYSALPCSTVDLRLREGFVLFTTMILISPINLGTK